MKTYIYRGGFPIVEKSGVGKAIEHQEKMLNAVQAPRAARWKEATVVHMNTVFPDSVIAAFIAKMQKKKVIYYGHSTMEDFKNYEHQDFLETVIRTVPGIGEAGVQYLFMLAGDENRCKPDVWIHRSIEKACGQDISDEGCQILFKETVEKLKKRVSISNC